MAITHKILSVGVALSIEIDGVTLAGRTWLYYISTTLDSKNRHTHFNRWELLDVNKLNRNRLYPWALELYEGTNIKLMSRVMALALFKEHTRYDMCTQCSVHMCNIHIQFILIKFHLCEIDKPYLEN